MYCTLIGLYVAVEMSALFIAKFCEQKVKNYAIESLYLWKFL